MCELHVSHYFYTFMNSFPVWSFLPDWSMFLREKSCSKGTKFCAVRVDSHWEGRQNKKWQSCSGLKVWGVAIYTLNDRWLVLIGVHGQKYSMGDLYKLPCLNMCTQYALFILESCQIDKFFVHDGMLAYSWSCYSHVFRYTELDLVIWGLN